MKPIIRFISHAPLIAAIALLSLLVSPSELLAQKNQFKCKHGIIDGDDGTGKCSLCGRGDEDRRRREKEAKEEREKARKKAIKDAEDAAKKAKEEADQNNAKEINRQVHQSRNNNSVQQFNSQPWNAQRKALLNSDPSAFKGQAEEREERARDIRKQASDALRNGDSATYRALSGAASELDSQSSAARSLGIRATMEQNSEKSRIENAAKSAESDRYWAAQRAKSKAESDRYWAAQRAKDDADHEARMRLLKEAPALRAYGGSASIPQTYTFSPSGAAQARRTFQDEVSDNAPDAVFDGVRDGIEEDTGFRTHVPGERIVTKPLEYIEDAKKRADQVSPLGNPIKDTIEKKMLPKILKDLDHPNAEPRRSDPSRGYPSGINPGSSGGGSRAPYQPPAALPHFAPPSGSQPITEQQVKDDFAKLKSGHGAPASSSQPPHIPLVPMPPEPKPNPNPPPAASPDPTVLKIFSDWLQGLGHPDPTPTPTPPPIKPVNLLEPSPKP